MKFKHRLPDNWIRFVSKMSEFANGATQVSIVTKNGNVYRKVLISNSTWIVAMRGVQELPFEVSDIFEIFQTEEDKNPPERGGWNYWDDWGK